MLVTVHLAAVPSPPGVESAAQFDSTRANSLGFLTSLLIQWLVVHGRVTCLVNSVSASKEKKKRRGERRREEEREERRGERREKMKEKRENEGEEKRR